MIVNGCTKVKKMVGWMGGGPLRFGPSPWDPLLISPSGGGGEWLAGEGGCP